MPYASGRHAEQIPGQSYVQEGNIFYVTQRLHHEISIAINRPDITQNQAVRVTRMLEALGWNILKIGRYLQTLSSFGETRIVVDVDLDDDEDTKSQPFTQEEIDAMNPRVVKYVLSIVFDKNNHFKTVADVRRETRRFIDSF